MKNFVIIFAFFMLLKPVLPVLEYIVFYDYFKNELCENKETPELECNGKCHLAKEMAKASDFPESGKEKRISVETNIVFYQEIELESLNVSLEAIKTKENLIYKNSYTYLDESSVFRPPVFA